ncbi:MAG: hypothetical protein JXR86_02180 [Spirochaetales bacterium]|nr:hypothetical protein [Spirochaetales bacterium]
MKKTAILILMLAAVQLSASTIIVNSIFDGERDPGASAAAGFVEDGLMDVLFDSGVILFSTFNAADYRVEGAKDARFMVTIEPLGDQELVRWKFQATVNGMVLEEGTVLFSEIQNGSGLDRRQLYYLIGEAVAEKISLYL